MTTILCASTVLYMFIFNLFIYLFLYLCCTFFNSENPSETRHVKSLINVSHTSKLIVFVYICI